MTEILTSPSLPGISEQLVVDFALMPPVCPNQKSFQPPDHFADFLGKL
jgi:hypothetical protein